LPRISLATDARPNDAFFNTARKRKLNINIQLGEQLLISSLAFLEPFDFQRNFD